MLALCHGNKAAGVIDTTNRLLVVPWSMAPTYCATIGSFPATASGPELPGTLPGFVTAVADKRSTMSAPY